MAQRQSTQNIYKKENISSEKKKKRWTRFFEAYTVNFNDIHFMAINPEVKGSKCGNVDDSQAVGLPRFKWQSSIFIVSNCRPGS